MSGRGPEPGAQPEAFKWEVGGVTLRRHFADRHEKLEILRVDNNGLRFHSPNESGWSAWWRKPPSLYKVIQGADGIYEDAEANWFNVSSKGALEIAANLKSIGPTVK